MRPAVADAGIERENGYEVAAVYVPAVITGVMVPDEMSTELNNHALTASAAESVADMEKLSLAEFAISTRTSSTVSRTKLVIPLTVLCTCDSSVPPYICTVANGKDAVLVAVPVTAMPAASVMKVTFKDP